MIYRKKHALHASTLNTIFEHGHSSCVFRSSLHGIKHFIILHSKTHEKMYVFDKKKTGLKAWLSKWNEILVDPIHGTIKHKLITMDAFQ